MKTVLITGAAGDVGTHLRRELAGRYKLRVSDIKPIKDLRKNEKFVRADVSKMADMLRATKGVDAIVHLGAWPVEGDWPLILSSNIVGGYNAFEAARRNGVKRVVFASSNHAVGLLPPRRDDRPSRATPKPDSRYGVSKAFGEALGALYAHKYGLEVLAIRIGNVNPEPLDKRRLAIWISPRDIAQLVSIGIDHPEIKFEIVYGVSENQRAWYDNSNAYPARLPAARPERGVRGRHPRKAPGQPQPARRAVPGRHLRRRRGRRRPEPRAPRVGTREARREEASGEARTREEGRRGRRNDRPALPASQRRAARATRTCTSTTPRCRARPAARRCRGTSRWTPTARCSAGSGSSA